MIPSGCGSASATSAAPVGLRSSSGGPPILLAGLLLCCLAPTPALAGADPPLSQPLGDTPVAITEGKPIPPPKPPDEAGPLPVSLGIYLIQLSNLDQVRQSFDIEGYLEARWTDPRLAFDAEAFGTPTKVYQNQRALGRLEEEMWWPSIEFVNAIGGGSLERHWLRVSAMGQVAYTARFGATVTSAMDLRRFPFDAQSLRIGIEPSFHPVSEVAFALNPDATGFDQTHSLPDWAVLEVRTSLETVDYAQAGEFYGEYSRFIFHVDIRRQWGFYLWKVFLPLLIILACSWSVFWIRDLETNLTIAFTVLLTVVAFNLAIADTLPKVPYLTFLDAVMVVSYVGVFLSLVVIMAVHLLERGGHEPAANRIQRRSRWSFPAGLTLVTALLSAAYL